MAQQPGMMNTAPSPIPGGYGNPAGANVTGTPSATPGAIPQAYGPPVGSIPTTGGTGGFPANTGGAASGTTTNPGLNNLSSGFGQSVGGAQTLGDFKRAYGDGPGQMLYDMISKGMFNPQVAQAMIAAMQPAIERGLSSTEAAFGAEGARFSSSAQIGVGDYESQAVLGENQVLANMYQQDQMAQLNLLENMMPTLHQEVVDSKKSGWDTFLQQFDWAEATSPGPPGSSKSVSSAMPGSTSASIPSSSPVQAQSLSTPLTGSASDIQSGTSSYFNDQYLQNLLSSSAGSQVGGVSPTGDISAYPGFAP